MRRSSILIILLTIRFVCALSQEYRLAGRIYDADSKLPLIGATIQIDSTSQGSITNELGFYKLKLNKGEYNLIFSFVGYDQQTHIIKIPYSGSLEIHLQPSAIQADEVIITAKNPKDNVESTESGTVMLKKKEIEQLPALMGETDFMRIIKLNPGVQAASDADMGFYVRGGGADQNLILLDGITLYNPSHVLGFFSVFNSDAISSTKLIKSGMPANHGGRLSSIVDVKTQNGNLTNMKLQGNIGLISSKLSFETPLVKDKASLLFTVRRSYIDEIIKPATVHIFNNSSSFYKNSKYYFGDLNTVIYWKPSTRNTFKISLYLGKDDFILNSADQGYNNEMDWGNKALSGNWNFSINSKWNLHQTIGLSQYQYQLFAKQTGVKIDLYSDVKDLSYKLNLTYADLSGSILKTGVEYIRHTFLPNRLNVSLNETDLGVGSNRQLNSYEISPFVNYEFDLISKLRFNLGLRYTNYSHTGPYYSIQKNEIGEISDSSYYPAGEHIKTYNSLEPRISARFQLSTISSIKASFTRNQQFTHLVSSSTVTLPTDVWLPSTTHIKPQKGMQYTTGYFLNLMENSILSSVNFYYKKFENQIELLYGLIHNYQDNLFEESMVFGKGESYGMELYFQKIKGNPMGWISYTLSKTTRTFDELNDGLPYPPKFDRRHDINIALTYSFNPKWSVSTTFIYATGNALTLPEYKYILGGNVISGYTAKNSYRLPAYHRLDLSAKYIARKTDKFESVWNFSIYNVYNHSNPFYIYFDITGNVNDYNLQITPKQVTIFPITPSISWQFKFL